jgi:hypothetical protein
LVGAVIKEAPSLIHARLMVAVRSIDAGAPAASTPGTAIQHIVLPPPDLPRRGEVLILGFLVFAGGAGEEVGQPGVAAFAGMRRVREMTEQRFAVFHARHITPYAVAGAAEHLGPKPRERAVPAPAVLVRGRARLLHDVVVDGQIRGWHGRRLPGVLLAPRFGFDLSDRFFQRTSRGVDIGGIEGQGGAGHFRKKGAAGALIQPPARVTGVRIERSYGSGHY